MDKRRGKDLDAGEKDMNVDKKEYLSALLDDEAGDFERRRLTDEIYKDDELAQTMGRYALVGELMRSRADQPLVMAKPDFLSGIQAEIAKEDESSPLDIDPPLVEQNTDSKVTSLTEERSKRQLPFVRYGMAAAVGALAMGIVLTQSGLLSQNEKVPMMTASVASQNNMQMATSASVEPTVIVPVAMPASYAQPLSLSRVDPQTRELLKQYLAEHVRYAPTTTLVPTVRAASYQQ